MSIPITIGGALFVLAFLTPRDTGGLTVRITGNDFIVVSTVLILTHIKTFTHATQSTSLDTSLELALSSYVTMCTLTLVRSRSLGVHSPFPEQAFSSSGSSKRCKSFQSSSRRRHTHHRFSSPDSWIGIHHVEQHLTSSGNELTPGPTRCTSQARRAEHPGTTIHVPRRDYNWNHRTSWPRPRSVSKPSLIPSAQSSVYLTVNTLGRGLHTTVLSFPSETTLTLTLSAFHVRCNRWGEQTGRRKPDTPWWWQ